MSEVSVALFARLFVHTWVDHVRQLENFIIRDLPTFQGDAFCGSYLSDGREESLRRDRFHPYSLSVRGQSDLPEAERRCQHDTGVHAGESHSLESVRRAVSKEKSVERTAGADLPTKPKR